MKKLSQEDFELAKTLIDMPVSRIHSFIQEMAEEAESL